MVSDILRSAFIAEFCARVRTNVLRRQESGYYPKLEDGYVLTYVYIFGDQQIRFEIDHNGYCVVTQYSRFTENEHWLRLMIDVFTITAKAFEHGTIGPKI